jgi:hypothetical protein
MFGTGQSDRDCGDGTGGIVDWIASFNDQNIGIAESAHHAAVISALKYKRPRKAGRLMEGLVKRQEAHFDAVRKGEGGDYEPEKLTGFVLRNAVMGIPLHGGEARWLIQRIEDARRSFLEPRRDHIYDILHTELQPKMYPYNPHGEGFHWRDIGAVIGTCVSPLRNRTGESIVDCDRLKANPP